MKIFCFVVLAIGCSGEKYGLSQCVDNNNVKRNVEATDHNIAESVIGTDSDNGAPYRRVNVEFDEKYMHLFRRRSGGILKYRIDDGNPDIHGRIERPCQIYDTFCIRKFFEEHSRCKISGRPVPEPLFRAQLTVNYPLTNMSVTQLNVEYKGLKDGRLEEFYINKATDNLVFTLNFPFVSFFSNETVLKFYLRGREPILTRDFGGIGVSFAVTVIIPNLKDLRLEKAEISSDFNIPAQPFVVGPGLAASTDSKVLAMLPVFFANSGRVQMEGALTEASFFATTFIQYNICDFGLKVL